MGLFDKILVEIDGKPVNVNDLNEADYNAFLDHVYDIRREKILSLFHGTIPKPYIVVYDKKDAPKGCVFQYSRIERNGMIDHSPCSLEVLKPGERIAHFYKPIN